MHKSLLALLFVALGLAAAAGSGTAQSPSSTPQQAGKANQGTPVGGPSGGKTAANKEVVVGFATGTPHKPLITKKSAQSKALRPPAPNPTPGSRGNKPPNW